MLAHLAIRDFALIERLELSLEPGFVVLTGETGAGKSILLAALELLGGARSRTDVIRSGADQAEVSAQFELQSPWLEGVNHSLGLHEIAPCEDAALVVRRVIKKDGRHKQFLNGSLVTVAQLKDVVGSLIDITSQHAQQALLRSGSQRELLDAFAKNSPELTKVASAHEKVQGLRAERDQLMVSEQQKLERADWLRYQINEIAELDPSANEYEELKTERERLAHAEKIQTAIGNAMELLADETGGNGIALNARRAEKEIEKAVDYEPRLRGVLEMLSQAAAVLEEAEHELSGILDDESANPHRLDEIESRLSAFERLGRKHGGDLTVILQKLEEMNSELEAIDNAEERLKEIDADLADANKKLRSNCNALSKKRRKAAGEIGEAVNQELAELGMKNAHFGVALSVLDEPAAFGAERIEFTLAANIGEAEGPLAKIASGGELSRVLLALKRVALDADPVPLTVFDEVDAGIGGGVGAVVGQKLKEIAKKRQAICVSHLGQIAGQADLHLRVEKVTENKRTTSNVRPLSIEERVDEIARMIGGIEITNTVRSHAKELLGLKKSKSPAKSPAKSKAKSKARART